MITHPQLPDVVREGIKREINSDIFAIPAIHEKIALLNPKHREVLEEFIDELLSKPIN
jgi:FixJ family two-component response regulator